MTFLLAVVAIILSIVALSRQSGIDYRIQQLERKLKELSTPQGAPSEEKTLKETVKPEPAFEAQPQPAEEASAGMPAQEENKKEQENALPAPQLESVPAKPANIAQIFSWIGGVLLVLGALFTFSYLIQKGYITMPLILSAAALIGILLTAVGVVIKDKKIQTTASTLCAAGLSVCFITAFAAYSFFNLIPAEAAFAFMALTAFASFAVSFIKDKKFISILALIAAFLTPILISSSENKYIFLFSYIFIVNLPAAAIAVRKGWNSLIWTALPLTFVFQLFFALAEPSSQYLYVIFALYALAAAASAAVPAGKIKENLSVPFGVFAALQVLALSLCMTNKNLIPVFCAAAFVTIVIFIFEFIRKSKFALGTVLAGWIFFYICWLLTCSPAPEAGFAALAIFAAFYFYPFTFNKRFKDGGAQWLAAAGASLAAFMPVYTNLGKIYFKEYLGLVPAFFALCYLLPAISFLNKEEFKKTKAVFTAAAVVFSAVILPVQFTGKWLTLLLSVYAAALCWLNSKAENKAFTLIAKLVFAVVFIRLVLNPALYDYCAGGTKIFNWYLLIFGAASASMLAGAHFCGEKENAFKALLKAGAAFLLFALMNIEIAHYFAEGGKLQFNFSGEFAEAVTYTLAWALYGAAACAVSFFNKSKILGKCGVIIICAALVKLALTDLWKLDTLYRICGVFGMAVLLIAVAFMFQKYNKNEQ